MITTDIQITNRLGLHARPAAQVAQTAAGFNCDIKITKDKVEINAKSIMGVLMLAAEYGSTLTLTFDGEDEQAACKAITDLFTNNFNEEF